MANLVLTPEWVEGIYQLETSDPVMGGPDGVDNKQAIQLGKRTEWLKKEVEKQAPKNNPAFTGTPTAPTPGQSTNNQQIATTAFVKTAIAALVGSAPAALDTLAEIATALGNDGNVKQVLLTEIGKKANASHTHTMGNITDFDLINLTTQNLDDIKKAGMYGHPATVNATTARNYPETTAGALQVLPSAYGWMQVYITHNTLRVFVRNLNHDGSWGSWKRVDALDKANLASPNFTGVPTAPTAAQSTNNTQVATTAFVKTAIAALVGSAPAALDTLAEIATALGNDGNVKQVLLTEIGKKANLTDFTNLKNLLVGIPFPYPLSAVPSGCLAFNGQTFSTSLYPELAKKYPSGRLPDLRGEFIRGWDNGRNVDAGRQLLSAQGDAIRNINGNFTGYDALNDDKTPHTGPFRRDSSYPLSFTSGNWVSGETTVSFDASRQVPTANENRPRNIAFQYICLAA